MIERAKEPAQLPVKSAISFITPPLTLENVPVNPHRLDAAQITSRTGFPVADSGCRPAPFRGPREQ